jgi:predicted MFS family arabinose efflux permease
VLVDAIGWQAIFALGVLLGLPTIALALTMIRESRDPDPSPVDWPGVGTLSLGLFLIVFAVLRGNALGWTSAPVLGLVAVGAVALAAFVRVELRVADPVLDLRLFRNRTFLGATVIVATLAGGSFGVFVYLSLFLLDVGGGSPVEVGLWLAPLAIAAFLTSLGAGRMAGRVPLTGALAAGMGLCAAGLLLMTGVDADSSWLHLLAGLVLVGAGTGLANPLATFTHLGVLPPAQGGLASGINNTARQLGLAVGIAVLGAVLQSTIAGRVEERTDGLGAARGAVTERIADGDVSSATQLAPAAARDSLRSTYEAAFASGLNELLLISVVLALIGLAAALVLVRTRDLWQPGV